MANSINTMGQLLDRNAAHYSENLAIISDESRITYGELRSKVNELARGLLALGVKKGDRVALIMDNRPEWIIIDFALGKIGAILVPINIRYRQHELKYILSHSKPSVLILIDRFRETNFIEIMFELCPELQNAKKGILELAMLPFLKYIFCFSNQEYPGMYKYEEFFEQKEIAPDHFVLAQDQVYAQDIAQILYTSGTTSFPKGVMLTHSNICINGRNIAERIHINDKDKSWVPIPLFFSFGCVTVVMATFAKGACLVLQRYFEPEEALKIIEKEKCSLMFATPAIYLPVLEVLSSKTRDISSLRSGSIMGTAEQIRRVFEEMGVTEIDTGYGMTETSALCSLTDSNEPVDIRINTVGRPFSGVSIVIKDPETGRLLPKETEGEICVKGYNVTQGYYNDPQRTSEAFDNEGFLRTGDIGLITDEGYLKFRGRFKDMLKTSGINVSALEVENFLETHPDVAEAYVVGIPDKVKDEVGLAFIRLSAGSSCTEGDILEYCKGKIASYKIPKYIRLVSEFPLTGSGKVQKFKLRERALKELDIKKEGEFK